jgi:FkbM family methyltransferase
MNTEVNKGLDRLQYISRISKAGRLDRLLYRPFPYMRAMFFNTVLYPFFEEGKTARATTFFGADMKVILPAGTDIYLLGAKTHDSEIRLSAGLISLIKPGDSVLDIGAHFGFFSLLAAHLCGPEGKVMAIEPASRTYPVLQENIKRYPQILSRQVAMGDRDGSITFFEFPLRYSEYNSTGTEQYHNEPWFQKIKPVENTVQLRKIDSFLQENSLNPGVIKIDAEGSEDLVIAGGQEYLQAQDPVVILEYLSHPQKNNAHQKAAQTLLSMGYHSFVSDMQGSLIPVPDIESYLHNAGLDSENVFFKK